MRDKSGIGYSAGAGRLFILLIAMLAWVLNGKSLCGESKTRVLSSDKRVSVVFPGENVGEQHYAVEPDGQVDLMALPTPGNETPNAFVSPEAIRVDMHLLNKGGETYVAIEIDRQSADRQRPLQTMKPSLLAYLATASEQDMAAKWRKSTVGRAAGYRFSAKEGGRLAEGFAFDIGAHRHVFYVLFEPASGQHPDERYLNSISIRG